MKTTIGIIGPIGAGKDTAADYLSARLHIPSYQISSPIKEICQQQGIEPTRENLIELGTKLANEHGDGYLAKYIIEKSPAFSIVVGMRQLGQIKYLIQHTSFTLIAVNASLAHRFERATARGELGEAKTVKEFETNELRENRPPRVQRLFECMKLANYTVLNNDTISDLHKKLDTIIAKEMFNKRSKVKFSNG